jgi:uncharacterized membrane protein
VTTLQWLLALHVTGAFLLLGGIVMSSVLGVLALRAERPSDVATYLGLNRFALPFLLAGEVMVLVFGLWLVHRIGFAFWRTWIVASLVLLVAAGIAGKKGGDREEAARALALELAGRGDAPSAELSARMRDPVTLALSWGAGLAAVAILALMIWKPGV